MSERDEFEGAWRNRYPEHGNSAFRRSELIPHGYVNTRVNDGWAMWQAAQCKSWGGWALDGWKLVPVHPTKEMRDAGAKINGQGWDFAHHTWRTMLLHAPAAPQPSQEPEKAVWLALRRLIYAIERVDACINEAGSVLSAALDERAAALNHARGFIPNPQSSRYQD